MSVRKVVELLESVVIHCRAPDSIERGARCGARALGTWEIETVERPAGQIGFEVLPKRWVVERTFGWLGRCRRLAKDYKNLDRFAVAYILLAMLRLMLRRLTRSTQCNQT